MKVYIGPYKNWFGPYQLAELLCFWVKKKPDEHGIKSKPEWVFNFGTWLAGGENNESWLYKIMLWVESKRKRNIKVRIDKYDTWNMDATLAIIILPMLKQLKTTKHGSPPVDDADVPEFLRSTAAPAKENEWDTDANWFLRWDWVLDQMIWSFEQLHPENDWEQQYYSGESDYDFVKEQSEKWGEVSKMVEGPKHTLQIDFKGIEAHNNRINDGLVLFGKYYRGLWD
jgi:hypothetical protein